MKLKKLGNNVTEIQLNEEDFVLFSYETPVACRINNVFYKTSKKWSASTSKHIKNWVEDCRVIEKDQSFFDVYIKNS